MLVALLAMSLAGLVALQVVLLAGVHREKDQAFDRAARTALGQVARRLDTGEVFDQVATLLAPGDSLGADTFWADHDRPHVIRVEAADSLHVMADTRFAAVFVDSNDATKAQLVRRVMLDLSHKAERPVTDRLDPAALDSLLPQALADAGLDVDVDYGVTTAGSDSLLLASGSADRTALAGSPYRARLFPTDFLPPAYDLVAHFPGRTTWAWRQTAPLLAGSVGLTLLVILCAVYAVRTILAQHRFAGELVTFVDNLTHEFKTPLATMALASEALARDDVRAEPDTLTRYAGMIGEEVRRLREHVDRILQLAHLERGEVILEREIVDVHETLVALTAAFELQVAEARGRLANELAADRSLVHADPVHLTGVLANLLDNAVKYSPATPEITVASANDGDQIVITVTDRGRGVPARDRERVFDRYYRCPTGDRHDVKGFGLGLSYVRQMVGLHGGSVTLAARDGGGTAVTVWLPLAREDGS